MRVFRFVAPIAALLLFAGPVHADPKGDVSAKIKAAMEAYDSFDYDGAKKQLTAEMRRIHALCDDYKDVATASLIEVWIDEAERRTWFLFEATRRAEG